MIAVLTVLMNAELIREICTRSCHVLVSLQVNSDTNGTDMTTIDTVCCV